MFDRDKDSGISSGFSPEKETILRDDTNFKGSLEFQNKLIINGKFEGTLTSKGILSVGRSGKVKAEIKVGSIIIEGTVHGNITADDKIELRDSAELHGDIQAKRLVITEGAAFIGNSDVNPHRAQETSSQQLKAEPKRQPQEVTIKTESKPQNDKTQTTDKAKNENKGKSLFSAAR